MNFPLLSSAGGERSNNFDALRLFAALLVIWGHHYAVLGIPQPLIAENEPGALGVVMFFAISGFLVTQSWLNDPHLLRFYTRRALRIWPGMCASVLLCVLALGPVVTALPVADYLRHPMTWDYLANLWLQPRFVLPGVFENNPGSVSVNGPLWTIPLEVGCYASLATLGILGLVRYRWFSPTVFLVLLAALHWRYSPPAGEAVPAWSFALQYGLVFALGTSMAVWRNYWQPCRVWTVGVCLALGLALHLFGPRVVSGQAPQLVLAALVVVVGSAVTPVLARAGRWGDFSYGLYIYAFPLQQLVVLYAGKNASFALTLVASVAAALALAILSWHGLEKPALAFKPRRSA